VIARSRRRRRWADTVRYGARALAIGADLRAALRLSPSALAALRRRRLLDTVAHAYQTVPYYRRLLEGVGLTPADIRTEADLRLMPTTSKDDLRSLPMADVVSTRVLPGEFRRYVTSGATGVPFVFYRTIDTEVRRVLGSYRVLLENGVRWRDRLLFIGLTAVFEDRWPQRLGVLPARVLSVRAPIEDQVQTLMAFRPTVLACYPSAARALAAAVLRARLDVPPLRRIFTSGETLDDHTADLARRVFGVRPLSTYACLEVGNIGWQCRPGGAFHTGDDLVIVEIVRDGAPVADGEVGELVVTALMRRDMPFIRYRTGDLARAARRSCSCRHAFGQIELAGGRVSEVFVLPDGTTRSALQATAAVHQVPGILQFQLRQDHADQLRVLIVTEGAPDPADTARLRTDLSLLLPGVAIAIEEVPEIPRTPGGKLPYALVSPTLRDGAAPAQPGRG
jgi:phenylacetate-CoA ligase